MKNKDKFAIYLKVKEQQINCRKYFNSMVQEVKLLNECAIEMA